MAKLVLSLQCSPHQPIRIYYDSRRQPSIMSIWRLFDRLGKKLETFMFLSVDQTELGICSADARQDRPIVRRMAWDDLQCVCFESSEFREIAFACLQTFLGFDAMFRENRKRFILSQAIIASNHLTTCAIFLPSQAESRRLMVFKILMEEKVPKSDVNLSAYIPYRHFFPLQCHLQRGLGSRHGDWLPSLLP